MFKDRPDRRADPRRRIGIAGAVGAMGGVLVNVAFRESFLSTKNGDAAYVSFISAYALCAALTWIVYLRPGCGDDGATATFSDDNPSSGSTAGTVIT